MWLGQYGELKGRKVLVNARFFGFSFAQGERELAVENQKTLQVFERSTLLPQDGPREPLGSVLLIFRQWLKNHEIHGVTSRLGVTVEQLCKE